MLKFCKDCDEAFEAREGYETRCFPCWKEWKNNRGEYVNPTAAERDKLKLQVDDLTAQVRRLQGELEQATARLRNEEFTVRALEDSLRHVTDKLKQHHLLIGEIKEHIPRLIQLCHPDRHAGSPAAHKATQWLLERRNSQ